MKLQKDLKEFVELLNSQKVEYLIVGGYALAYHGHPRYTGDIDFFIRRSEQNASALEKVLSSFGFGHLGIKTADFLQTGIVVQLGRPPYRIDLLTAIDGVEFDKAWQRREQAHFEGVPVSLINKEDLIANKRASGRPQDLADVQKLGSLPLDRASDQTDGKFEVD